MPYPGGAYGTPRPIDYSLKQGPLWRPDAASGLPAMDKGVLSVRQVKANGSLVNSPSLTLDLLPYQGSVLIAFFFGETSTVKIPVGGGVNNWQHLAIIQNTSPSSIFTMVWLGVVSTSPSTSVTSSTGNTTGLFVTEVVGRDVRVVGCTRSQSYGPMSAALQTAERGLVFSLVGHRGGTPTGPPGWTVLAQQSNDGSLAVTQLHYRRTVQWTGAGNSPAHTLLALA